MVAPEISLLTPPTGLSIVPNSSAALILLSNSVILSSTDNDSSSPNKLSKSCTGPV